MGSTHYAASAPVGGIEQPARAPAVEPMVGIALMTEDLFVFFEPSVEPIEVERDQPAKRWRSLRRSQVTPRRLRSNVIADAHIVVGRCALIRVVGLPIAPFEHIRPNVFERKIPLDELAGLVQHRTVARVHDRFSGEHAADSFGHFFEIQDVLGCKPLEIEVVRTAWRTSERRSADCQGMRFSESS